MAVSIFACPDCGSTLKSKQALAAGTKIRCPKCQTIFAIPERNGAADADDEEAPPPSRPVAAGREAARKAGPKPPPLRPQKEEFAEYDDGDDDDEEEVRPKKKKKLKGKKKSPAVNPVLIGAIAGVVLLLAVGGVLGWVWPGFFIKLGNEPLAYVPPNSTFVGAVDLEVLIDRLGMSAQFDQILSQIPADPEGFRPADCKKETGLEPKELFNQVTLASLTPLADWQNGQAKMVVVVKSKTPFDGSKVIKFLEPKAQQERVKGRTVYKSKSKTGEMTTTYFPNNQVFVSTNLSDTEFEPILASRGHKPLLSADTMALVEPVCQNQLWAVAPFNGDVRQKLQQAIRSAPAGSAPDTAAFQAALPNAKGAGGWLIIDNNQVKLTLGVMCADADTAKKVSTEAQHGFDKQTKGLTGAMQMTVLMAFVPEPLRPFTQELLNSVRFTAQDTTATVSVQAGVASIKNVIQVVQQAGPALFMGGTGGMAPGMNPGRPGAPNPGRPQPGVPPRGGRGAGRPPR